MTWRLKSQRVDTLSGFEAILSVIALQDAWRSLSPMQRSTLRSATPDGQLPPMHGNMRRSLVAHGICDEAGVLTPAGRDVLKYRPDEHTRVGRTADAFETGAEIAAHERRLDV